MPKERKERSVAREKFKGSALLCSESSRGLKGNEKEVKEWEEARCPVCIEHPHNGILLICSSYENGCRPYMCDTSHRHSNCFDQFRKASKEAASLALSHEVEETDGTTEMEDVASDSIDVSLREEAASEVAEAEEEEEGFVEVEEDGEKDEPKLTCPLCRGHIKEWVVVKDARRFMNSKRRSCSSEFCDFSGTYSDLRKHARVQHPGARPSEADPERQRSWRRLERQRDLGDLLSTLQSSFGGEHGSIDEEIIASDRGVLLQLQVFIVFQMIRPEPGSSRRSSSWSGTSRARSHISARRRSSTPHWGELYEGDTGASSRDEENHHHQSPDEQASRTRRRRVRRRTFIDSEDEDEET